MSPVVVHVSPSGAIWLAEAAVHRFGPAPEMAARLAAAAVLGCAIEEVEIIGQTGDYYLAHQRPLKLTLCKTCLREIVAGKPSHPLPGGYKCDACWQAGQAGSGGAE